MVDVERWLSYKGTCHVILLAKLHDRYLYKTDNFFHINHYLVSLEGGCLTQVLLYMPKELQFIAAKNIVLSPNLGQKYFDGLNSILHVFGNDFLLEK